MDIAVGNNLGALADYANDDQVGVAGIDTLPGSQWPIDYHGCRCDLGNRGFGDPLRRGVGLIRLGGGRCNNRDVLFGGGRTGRTRSRSEEHTSELQSLMRISYA